MEKPSLPSGTRDFGPEVMMRRKFITGNIERVFRLYGFAPIETPALENLRTLQGKYGDEGDQLLFRVLNSGDFLAKANETALHAKDSKAVVPQIADRGLRYDLTVPLARFVVMNRDKIHFPFRRYQMQPVWRADRPQKGRYREFWQCDADVVGSNSISNEADLTKIYDDVFSALGLKVNIRINHRAVLDAFGPWLGGEKNLIRFMQLIDKADKIGFEGVCAELNAENMPNAQSAWEFLHQTAQLTDNAEKLRIIEGKTEIQNEHLSRGLSELKTLFSLLEMTKNFNEITFDLTLARGLSYYTGCVFEVVPADNRIPADFRIGSIGGGGRYDNLTGVFGLKDVSGTGISFGLDRIYDIMDAAQLFPEGSLSSTQVLFCPMTEEALSFSFAQANTLRNHDISAEVYPAVAKLKKQLDYANNKGIAWAVIVGEDELKNQSLGLKNLNSGEQISILVSELENHLHLWQF